MELNLGKLHAKQTIAFESVANEIMYGGAAGGGKSHLFRTASIIWALEIPGLQTYIFRRELGDLIKNHMEGPKGYKAILAPLVNAKLCQIVESEIRFINGSKIYLCHCKNPDDVYGYDGSEIHLLLIDEITQWLEWMYRFLRHRVRAPGLKIPLQYRQMFPRIMAGTNPGNIGHMWVKATWIDGATPVEIRQMPKAEGGMRRQFIPALLEDNPTMAADDPEYEARLEGMGSDALVKAKRFGLWDIIAGAYFDKLRKDRHALKPFAVPKHWTRYRSIDWGYSVPFSVGWWAIADEAWEAELEDGTPIIIPRNALIRYREWYGCQTDPETGRIVPNSGIKMDVEDFADQILKIEFDAGEFSKEGKSTVDGQLSVADPSMFKHDSGPSLAERAMTKRRQDWAPKGMDIKPIVFQPADNQRVAGWQQVASRLSYDDEGQDPPMLYAFATCAQFWRTVPALQHDDKKPEDIDTDGEDHVGDDVRYACMARPISRVLKTKRPSGPAPWTVDWVIAQDEAQKNRRQSVR